MRAGRALMLVAAAGAGVMAARRWQLGRRVEHAVQSRFVGVADHGLGGMSYATVETPAPGAGADARFEVTRPEATLDVTPLEASSFDARLELESIEGPPAQPTPQQVEAEADAER